MRRVNVSAAIQRALEQIDVRDKISATANLSGGCIHQVMRLTLDDGRHFIAKANRADNLNLFEEEAHSLRALAASGAVLVPKPLACVAFEGAAVLLMTMVQPPPSNDASDAAWQRLGDDLAALHRVDAGPRYGFEIDNHLGATLQPNAWRDDWVEFNAINRLGFQLEMAGEKDLLHTEEVRRIEAVIARLNHFIPRHPKPALLHGDLWSGNALPSVDEHGELRIALIDPACSIGDGWADIAMMRLFGGFPESCFKQYRNQIGEDDQIQQRLVVYQLYHVLNHANLFGRGYVGQVLALAKQLGAG